MSWAIFFLGAPWVIITTGATVFYLAKARWQSAQFVAYYVIFTLCLMGLATATSVLLWGCVVASASVIVQGGDGADPRTVGSKLAVTASTTFLVVFGWGALRVAPIRKRALRMLDTARNAKEQNRQRPNASEKLLLGPHGGYPNPYSWWLSSTPFFDPRNLEVRPRTS